MNASKKPNMFLPISRKERDISRGCKATELYKSKSQLLGEYLKNQYGPLKELNQKMLNSRIKLHERRKAIANGKHKLKKMNASILQKPSKKASTKQKQNSPKKQNVVRSDLNKMTVSQLKQYAKNKNLKGRSQFQKKKNILNFIKRVNK